MELEEDRSFSDQSPGHFRAKFLDDEVMFLVLLVPADLSGLSDTLWDSHENPLSFFSFPSK